jgi:hypothetical protein
LAVIRLAFLPNLSDLFVVRFNSKGMHNQNSEGDNESEEASEEQQESGQWRKEGHQTSQRSSRGQQEGDRPEATKKQHAGSDYRPQPNPS